MPEDEGILQKLFRWLLPVPVDPSKWTTYPGHVNNARDIPVTSGTRVIAPVAGKVEFAGERNDGRGGTVRIRTNNGFTIYLSHLKGFSVKAGDVIKQGQMVGFSGGGKDDPMRGFSTGPHLHLEILDIFGKGIDPGPQKMWTSYKEPGAPGSPSPDDPPTWTDVARGDANVGDLLKSAIGLPPGPDGLAASIPWDRIAVGVIGAGLIIVGVAGLAGEQAIGAAAGKIARPIAEALKS